MTGYAPLTLQQLAHVAATWGGAAFGQDVLCTRVVQDSRRVTSGALFAVRPGQLNDGARYVHAALAQGASGLLIERSEMAGIAAAHAGVPLLVVNDWVAALGPVAHAALGYPAQTVNVSGVTGTNGKTTVVGLVRQCLERLGRTAASLGTLGYEYQGTVRDLGMTTPDADMVAEVFAAARDSGVQELLMEVSSHALSLGRVDGFRFKSAGYLNITQDHLDFHGTFAAYAATKRKLFVEDRAERAVLNIDDPELEALSVDVRGKFSAGLICVGRAPSATLKLVSVSTGLSGSEFTVSWAGVNYAFQTRLLGEHNVSNWLVALGMLIQRGIDLVDLATVVPTIEPAPGRLQRCNEVGDDVTVLVDYAHTPDALERALLACRALGPQALWCVFGCGGDRDRGKRPLMGAIAARLADRVVVTNDNPRTEDAAAIAAAITEGVGSSPHRVILDRRVAIAHAINHAQPGDLILVAGKGHEDYQIFGRDKVHFDDRQESAVALRTRRLQAAKQT